MGSGGCKTSQRGLERSSPKSQTCHKELGAEQSSPQVWEGGLRATGWRGAGGAHLVMFNIFWMKPFPKALSPIPPPRFARGDPIPVWGSRGARAARSVPMAHTRWAMSSDSGAFPSQLLEEVWSGQRCQEREPEPRLRAGRAGMGTRPLRSCGPRCVCGASPANRAPPGPNFWRRVPARSAQRTCAPRDSSFKPYGRFTGPHQPCRIKDGEPEFGVCVPYVLPPLSHPGDRASSGAPASEQACPVSCLQL